MVKTKLKYLGHASFQIKVDDKIIYIDPYAGEYIDKADLILITHSHRDHCDISKIKAIQKEDTLIYGPKPCSTLISNMEVIQEGSKINFNNIIVKAVPAYNIKRFRAPGIPFHPKGFGVGYLITIDDKTLYHAGDTDYIPEMKTLENIHLAMLPIGGTYTMDIEEAVEAAKAIKPKIIIPMHMRNNNPNEFAQKIGEKMKVAVLILEPNEEYEIIV